MGRRAIVVFWGAVAAAVFFLGSAWSTAERLGAGSYAPSRILLLAFAILGLAVAVLVAGRIAFVVGRTQRATRRRSHREA